MKAQTKLAIFFLFYDLYVSRVINPGVWVVVHNLHLVALGAPSPPEELVAVGAAHDGREAVVAGILALSLGDVDAQGEPSVSIDVDGVGDAREGGGVGGGRLGREWDRIGGGGRCCVDRLHISELQLKVFDELGVGEVELLQLGVFRLKGVGLSHWQGVAQLAILDVVVEIAHILGLAV